jgi:hypothetical protein
VNVEAQRIVIEILTGKSPSPPDDARQAELRERLREECREIAARGGVVDVPGDSPA